MTDTPPIYESLFTDYCGRQFEIKYENDFVFLRNHTVTRQVYVNPKNLGHWIAGQYCFQFCTCCNEQYELNQTVFDFLNAHCNKIKKIK